MKKNYLLAFCMLSLLAESCQQDELVPGYDGMMTVGATMEGETIFPSRSNVSDAGEFTWYLGDEIGVYGTKNGESAFYPFELKKEYSGQKKGYFKGTVTGDVSFTSGYAIYPYANKHTYDGTTLTLHLPDEYNYEYDSEKGEYIPNTNALMIASLENSSLNDLQFNHVGGVVCVTLDRVLPQGTCGVRLNANKKIAGDFAVSNPTDGNPTISTDSDDTPAVTADTDGDEGNTDEGKSVTIRFEALKEDQKGTMKFYFPVPTGTGYQFGLVYLVDKDENKEITKTLIEIHSDSHTNDIERTRLLIMETIKDVTVGGNTESGSTLKITTNDEAKAALAEAAENGTVCNLLVSSGVDQLVLSKKFAEDGANSLINVTYTEASSSLEVVIEDDTESTPEVTAMTRTAATEATCNGVINIYIPKTSTSLSEVKINTPKLAVTINENKADAVGISKLTVENAAKLVLGSGVNPTTVDGYYKTGDEAKWTYTVYTAAGLMAVNALVNEDLSANIILADDIDLTKSSDWTPIGSNSSKSYKGVFDGGGHTITGLTISNATKTCQGLVGYLDGSGTIKDVTLKDCTITSVMHSVGGIAGQGGGYISGCTISGTTKIQSTYTNGNTYIGGILGYGKDAAVSDCKVIGAVEISGNRYVGGIVGYNVTSAVKDCYVSATENNSITIEGTGTGSKLIAGITGYNLGSSLSGCYVSNSGSGNITIKGTTTHIAGIVGNNTTTSASVPSYIDNCYVSNTGTGKVTIEATEGTYMGGIAGANDAQSTVTNCKVTGEGVSISSDKKCNVGGIVGVNHNLVAGCIAEQISVKGDYRVGGIAGQNNGVLVACYADGINATANLSSEEIPDDERYSVGGLVGLNAGSKTESCPIIACYAEQCTLTGTSDENKATADVVGINTYYYNGANNKGTRVGTVTTCYYTPDASTYYKVYTEEVTAEGSTTTEVKATDTDGDNKIDLNGVIAAMNKAINSSGYIYRWSATNQGVTVGGSN